MKRLMEWAARLYPRAWRERYGVEFRALIEDVRPGWRELWDVLRGACGMQMRTWELPKFAIGFGLLGLVVAGVIAFRTQDVFQSSATLRIPPGADAIEVLQRAQVNVLSRNSLAEVMFKEDLYRGDRQRYPIEDVVQAMRKRIRISSSRSGIGPGETFRIDFQYPDAVKAQQTTNLLMQRMAGQTKVDSIQPITLEVIDPPSPAKNVGSTRRLWIAGLGLGLGILLGTVVWGVKRWPIVALAGAGGAVVAASLSFLLPNQYISSTTLRADSPDEVNRIVETVMNPQSLSEIILRQRAHFDLYPEAREKAPIADLVERIRRDIQIRSISGPVGRSTTDFRVAFVHFDRFRARAALNALVAAMIEANLEINQAAATKGRLELLDPPFLPERPVSPNRMAITLGGCFAGLLLVGAVRWFRRRRLAPQPA